jgi:O-antigen/teichoic acid export membrane protein
LFFFRNFIFKALQLEEIFDYWYLIPFTVLFLGLFYSLTYLSIRKNKYKLIAKANLSYNGLNSAFKIGLYYLKPQAWGLITGNLLGIVLSCLSFFALRKRFKKACLTPLSVSIKASKKFKDFPLFSMNRAFVSSVSVGLPMLLFPDTFGQAKLGLYFMAFTLLFRPVNLISNSLYQVIYNKFASARRENMSILPMLKKYCFKSILYTLPCFILAGLISEPLFSVYLGKTWTSSCIYFRLLLPWVFMILLTTPLGFIPILFNRQGTNLWIEIAYLFARMLAIFTGIWYADFELSIALFSGVGFVFMTLTLLWYIRLTKKYEAQLIR